MRRELRRLPVGAGRRVSWLRSPHLALLLRIVLGGLFVWASGHKILHPQLFAEEVANYGILPPVLVNLCALILPWVELIAGSFLILGLFTRSSALTLCLLLLVFLIAISLNLFRGIQIECGCFGPGEELGWPTLVRDLLMLALGAQVLFSDGHLLSLDALIRSRQGREEAGRRGKKNY
jgi:putative oxidoreductase